jgi:hypothetical protein
LHGLPFRASLASALAAKWKLGSEDTSRIITARAVPRAAMATRKAPGALGRAVQPLLSSRQSQEPEVWFMTRTLYPTFLLILFTLTGFSTAHAADRVYTDGGSVWAVSFIETKPGHFDDYIADLNQVWRRYLDEQKKDGDVVSYKLIPISFPRDGEANLMLMVEYKNWATFDRNNEYFDGLAKRLQGGVDQARQSNIDREALRTLRGGFVGQEIKLKK